MIEGSFKRKKILNENHLLHIICYIHRNPIHHRITAKYSDYPYSSYQHVREGDHLFIVTETIIDRFGGINNFISAHNEFKQLLGDDFYLE